MLTKFSEWRRVIQGLRNSGAAILTVCLVLLGGTSSAEIVVAPKSTSYTGNSALSFGRDLPQTRATTNMFGSVGLLDMPTAESRSDGMLSTSLTYVKKQQRTVIGFQITPRLSGNFRYSILNDWRPNTARFGGDFFDRSFDIAYRFVDETRYRPAIAVGLIDFVGTGIYGSEYVVATKHVTPKIKVSAGIGWGRISTADGFSNPFGLFSDSFNSRPGRNGTTGRVTFNRWFKGDAALFGGVEWQATDRLGFKAEYSSDAYEIEIDRDIIEHRSPFNFGMTYRVRPAIDLGVNYMFGTEVGVVLTFKTDPKTSKFGSGLEAAPQPVTVRPARNQVPAEVWGTQWVTSEPIQNAVQEAVVQAGTITGLNVEGVHLEGKRIEIQFHNTRFSQSAQAVGRFARLLTGILPPSIERFDMVLIEEGMLVSRVILHRSDLERLEHAPDGAWQSYARADISDAGSLPRLPPVESAFPKLTYGISPYAAPSFFDPNSPILIDAGAEASARYKPTPGLVFSGALRFKLFSNRDSQDRVSNSVLPKVRSESDDYSRLNDIELQALTAEYFFRPGRNLYGRVSAGYLETEYGGASAEVLWKKPGNRLALGAELNYFKQREPGELFAFGTGTFGNDGVSGHVSAYYDIGNGFEAQLDVGQYLAGDIGATFAVDRTFGNGWSAGAFFTLTDVSFDDFGEGSFDKGIRFSVPLSQAIGQPNRSLNTLTLRPVTRDGGARLSVSNRLYPLVRQHSDPDLGDGWGRFWR